ncbi:MAG: hypothetical protein WBM32_23725 [Crocosphaera sp.]|jgi:hypothetical protein
MRKLSIQEQIERDRQQLKEQEKAKFLCIQNELKKDYEKLKQQQTANNFKIDNDIRLTKSTTYINHHSSTNISDLGLGIYGLTKIFTNNSQQANLYRNLDFFEKITREYEEEAMWRDLEIDSELQALKASIT